MILNCTDRRSCDRISKIKVEINSMSRIAATSSTHLHLPVVTDFLILYALTFVQAGVFITIMTVTVFVVVRVIVLVVFVKRPNRGQWYEVQDGTSRQDRHNHGGDDLKHRTTERVACMAAPAIQTKLYREKFGDACTYRPGFLGAARYNAKAASNEPLK